MTTFVAKLRENFNYAPAKGVSREVASSSLGGPQGARGVEDSQLVEQFKWNRKLKANAVDNM